MRSDPSVDAASVPAEDAVVDEEPAFDLDELVVVDEEPAFDVDGDVPVDEEPSFDVDDPDGSA